MIAKLPVSNLLCLQPKSVMKKPEVGRLVRELVIALVQVGDNKGPGHVGASWNRVPIVC